MSSAAQVILASASPRRRELLQQIGVVAEVRPVDVDESIRAGEAAGEFVTRLAVEKAEAGWFRFGKPEKLPVLGADTVVVYADRIMGKPRDRDDAVDMLQQLSGKTHQVLTAVAVASGTTDVRLNESRVTFRTFLPQEYAAYWDSGEPAGKAGAYAIQGLAAVFVERLEGSFSGVMGLPVFETAILLKGVGIDVVQQA